MHRTCRPYDTQCRNAAIIDHEATKQATLITMLRAPEGATIVEIVDPKIRQSRTVSDAMAGALKEKLEFEVASEKVEGRELIYKAPALQS